MMLPLRYLRAVGIVLIVASLHVAAPAVAADAPLKIDRERLGRLDAVIEDYVQREQIAGGVIYLARNGRTEHLKAYGAADKEAGQPMKPDAIFRLASMSKAVTTVAALMLYEEGKFMLNDKVSKYIPEFANSVVAVAPPADAPAGTKFVTVPAKREITIRDLMRHTAGLSYGDKNTLVHEVYTAAGVQGWYFADKAEPVGEAIKRLAKLPLVAQPGEAFVYGFGTDVLGYLVEVVAGMPLDQFFAERIFRPLNMPDTSFFLPKEKLDRLTVVYSMEKGKLVRKASEQGDYVEGPRQCFSGGAGLLSTAKDYGRFLQMLLNEGELDGVRLLSPKTVRLMSENHTGELFKGGTAGFGLGFWVNNDPGFHGEINSEGAYGWGSAYFPQYFVDPEEKMIGIFLTQLRPAGSVDLNQKFKILIYQSLVN